jgi:hypothetical protein
MVAKVQYSGFAIKTQAGRSFDFSRDNRPRQERKPLMLRTILIAAAALCASHGAFAQELTAAQRDACMGDYEKYCKGVTPGGGRIIACLNKEADKLTPACKKVLADAEKK